MGSRLVIQRPWQVGVIIPARDEEELIPRCLRSVLVAASRLPSRFKTHVVVASDSSTDRTSQIASELLQSKGAVIDIVAGTVGTARALGVKKLLQRCRGALDRLWLANTDADCAVPPSWLADQLALAGQGIEAIAGTVSVDSFAEHGPEVAERFLTSYHIFPDGSHPHIHGANFGVRADAYLRAGGWADLKTAEDHDLWGRLSRGGAVTKSTAEIEVVTSGRRVGRAPSGFAGALAAHNEGRAA